MSEDATKLDMVTEFLADDALIRGALARYPTWSKRQEAMTKLRDAFPDIFAGTAMEAWEPLSLSMVLDSPAVIASGLPAKANPVDLQTPRSDEAAGSPLRSPRETNKATARLAEEALRRAGHPMTSGELEVELRAGGWTGFPYLANPTPHEVRWTLYRVLQSRPLKFALRGKNGRWGLIEWPREDNM